ncbi:unnamed protein product [Citrullus colocynthis]|uniref:Uncharacterized protein n=1 Tax=Citrullus colocynthis TaxID=252529 RepID=A0ABP0XTE9_9ROSI
MGDSRTATISRTQGKSIQKKDFDGEDFKQIDWSRSHNKTWNVLITEFCTPEALMYNLQRSILKKMMPLAAYPLQLQVR